MQCDNHYKILQCWDFDKEHEFQLSLLQVHHRKIKTKYAISESFEEKKMNMSKLYGKNALPNSLSFKEEIKFAHVEYRI